MEAMNDISEGEPVSLQPFVRQQSDNHRSIKISERIHQAGVLQSNRWEEFVDRSLDKRDSWASLCQTSYRPYSTEYLMRPKFEAWEQREYDVKYNGTSIFFPGYTLSVILFRNYYNLEQGIGARLMIDHHGSEYHNNWTTTHDLSYKILPKGLSGPQLREFNASNKQWRPAQDYAQVYGNQTGYGLTDFMKYKWFLENEPTRLWRTHYRDVFRPFPRA